MPRETAVALEHEPTDHHLFLSYAAADRERALAIADALEAAGIHVWIDRRGIPGGAEWAARIAQAVRTCRAVAVLCSAASVASRNVRQELQLAWDHDKPILPLLLEPVDFPDAVAYFLQGRQWIDLSDRTSEGWVSEVARALGGSTAEAAAAVQVAKSAGPSGNLPIPATPIVGRDVEVDQVAALLNREDVRLVTLTGPGGVGKTRLAIAVAEQLQSAFADGIWFVRLAPLHDSSLVAPTIAAVLGIRDEGTQPQVERLQTFLRDKRLLLVIDNVEHVIAAVPDLAGLLAHGAGIKMLATSRTVLHLSGETEFPVNPLPAPSSDHGRLSALEAGTFASVRLFVQRAAAAKPGFVLSDGNADAVAAICARLDGLPLAIEIAAARIKLIPPAALLVRLEKRLPLLTGGARDLPERQQTLRSAIAWSYDLLSPEEQTLFRRLGVFAGGCTLEAAEAVAGSGDELEIFDGLASLVDKSLLRLDESGDEPRFRMLETIREFAAEELQRNGEAADAQRAHADWCLSLAKRAYDVCVRGAVQPVWISRIVADDANMQTALRWLEQAGDVESWLGLAATLTPMWLLSGRPRQADESLARGLTRAESASPETRARALYWGGDRAMFRGELEEAAALGEQCRQIFAELGDVWGVGIAEQLLARVHWSAGNHERAEPLFTSALTAFQGTGSRDWEALGLVNMGEMALDLGQLDRAASRLSEALAMSRDLNDPWGVAIALNSLGLTAVEQDNYGAAAAHLVDALATWRELGVESTDFARWLESTALLAERTGATDAAVRLFRAAATHRDRSGQPHIRGDQSRIDEAVGRALANLGESKYAAIVAAGQAISIDDAIAEAWQVLTAWQAAGTA
jgi:predicted ATPase